MLSAVVLGAHLMTAHEEAGYRSSTPGLYVVTENCLTLGAYRNSIGKRSVYVGCTLGDRYAVTIGAVTGYGRPLSPLVIPSISQPLGRHLAARIAFVPKPTRDGSAALHLSLEWRF